MNKKPKQPSELERLRAFARQFTALGTHGHVEVAPGVGMHPDFQVKLVDEARYALTGKASPQLSQHLEVRAAVKKIGKMSREQLGRFLAG